MNYSIIGSGNVGTALARQFANAGIAVGITNSRGPDSLAALVKELGEKIIPQTLSEALKADIVILALPFRAHVAIASATSDWSGKIIVDAMNAYGLAPEELNGQASSDIVAAAFPGAKVVKTLNQLPAKLLAMNPVEKGGRRVMFLASNDAEAAATVAELVEKLGFATISLGKLNAGGALLGMRGPLILQNLIKLT
ncbi:NADPH-dependent F420 reductase [Undibacterium sp. TJN19]|uniref:NADPH-dependent F420 reductase n=1 Tax=Undibacterium sp. TJN19 TaxID=3413055 RepID=UPI003BF28206